MCNTEQRRIASEGHFICGLSQHDERAKGGKRSSVYADGNASLRQRKRNCENMQQCGAKLCFENLDAA